MYVSRDFNNFINDYHLIEHKLNTRKFTWSNGTRFALLDRVFSTVTWDLSYSSNQILDLNSTRSDHCPLLVRTNSLASKNPPMFRFDPLWLEQEDFLQLLPKWWNETPLSQHDIALS